MPVPLSSSLSGSWGEMKVNNGEEYGETKNGDMNRISWLVSRPGWFDGFLLSRNDNGELSPLKRR